MRAEGRPNRDGRHSAFRPTRRLKRRLLGAGISSLMKDYIRGNPLRSGSGEKRRALFFLCSYDAKKVSPTVLYEVTMMLVALDVIPKRLCDVVCGYVFFLTLVMKRHDLRVASEVVGLHESRFCAMLNDPVTPEISRARTL